MGRARRATARIVLRPFHAFLGLLFALSAGGYLSGTPRPRSVDEALPGPVLVMWGVCLLAGGVLLFTGVMIGRERTEKAGLMLIGGGSAVYSAAVFALAGLRGLLPGGLVVAVAAACAVSVSDRLWVWATLVLGRPQ